MACKKSTRFARIPGLWTPTKYHKCIRGELKGRKFPNKTKARKAFKEAVKKCKKLVNRK